MTAALEREYVEPDDLDTNVTPVVAGEDPAAKIRAALFDRPLDKDVLLTPPWNTGKADDTPFNAEV